MTLTSSAIDATARRLMEAAAIGRPCAPVRDLLPADDLGAAYAAQQRVVAARTSDGALQVGRKIGLTNPAVQAQLRVDQPDYGVLFDDMRCPADRRIEFARLLQPRIEAEIAFVLATDLPGSDVDEAAVAAATDHVVPALEIVDSRIAGWDISIVDTIADNASSGLFVLGDTRHRADDRDLVACTMTLHRGDELVSTGTGADCLGSPLAAVAWLARTAAALGAPLRAGEVILSGALGPVVPVRAGDVFVASVSGLGSVRAEFGS
jgi:2-keto-4-pentenoate hydratase